MTVYVGMVVPSSVFPDDCFVGIRSIPPEAVMVWLEGREPIVSAFNPIHSAVIDAVQKKFGIILPVSDTAPKLKLERGDVLIIVQGNFERQLSEGERYTQDEIDDASISFKRWIIQ